MRILVIEDEAKAAKQLKAGLELAYFQVELAVDGNLGYRLASSGSYDALVVDIMLPGMSGLELVEKLRAGGVDTPALFLSAKGTLEDRLRGLKAGGDDYIVKPFSMRELAARIRANVRRRPAANEAMEFGGVTIDRDQHSATHEGTELGLTPKEFELLAVLAEEPGRVVPRTELYARIWDPVWVGSGKSLDVHVTTLRKKLPPTIAIEAVRGVGYRLAKRAQ